MFWLFLSLTHSWLASQLVVMETTWHQMWGVNVDQSHSSSPLTGPVFFLTSEAVFSSFELNLDGNSRQNTVWMEINVFAWQQASLYRSKKPFLFPSAQFLWIWSSWCTFSWNSLKESVDKCVFTAPSTVFHQWGVQRPVRSVGPLTSVV